MTTAHSPAARIGQAVTDVTDRITALHGQLRQCRRRAFDAAIVAPSREALPAPALSDLAIIDLLLDDITAYAHEIHVRTDSSPPPGSGPHPPVAHRSRATWE